MESKAVTRFTVNRSNTVQLSCNFLFHLSIDPDKTHVNMNSIPVSATRPTTGVRVAQVVGLTASAYLAGKAHLDAH
jgi:hypothetical protein